MRDLIFDLEQGAHLSDPDPKRRAQIQMRTPLPKRFYKATGTEPAENGFAVTLDGKVALTPGRARLVLPTDAAARLVADEFAAQGTEIDPVSMPVMRLANMAIDGVARDPGAVADDILRFASSDLLFYRADGPERLVARQAQAWDPVLAWAREAIGARFRLGEGVMFVEQPPEAIEAVRRHLGTRTEPFRIASLHLITTLTGSALLALGVEAGALAADEAWTAAHVDEAWNAEQWGQDAEAVARHNNRCRDMKAAVALLEALGRS